MDEDEIICNRCGFGTDELDESVDPSDQFAQLGYEMYCNDCVLEWKDGVWEIKEQPDDYSPTLKASGTAFTDQTLVDLSNRRLFTYGPVYFNQKKERSMQILDDVRKALNIV